MWLHFEGSQTQSVLHGLSNKSVVHSGVEEVAKDACGVHTHVLAAVSCPGQWDKSGLLEFNAMQGGAGEGSKV